ncbi:hypothetical protein P8452_20666 [Trifolium repens]|nr:hypothetical protein P8452_20666 [Trifolium repens]
MQSPLPGNHAIVEDAFYDCLVIFIISTTTVIPLINQICAGSPLVHKDQLPIDPNYEPHCAYIFYPRNNPDEVIVQSNLIHMMTLKINWTQQKLSAPTKMGITTRFRG